MSTPVASIHHRNFPDGFIFGAGTSSYQIEGAANKGGRGPSIWDNFTQRFPERIKDGSNGIVATDSYNRVKEDVQIMKKLGLDAYRFSISWSRLLPNGKLSGGVNREGIDYYNSLIDELLENGMEPYVTLFHWDLPQSLEAEYQGFLSSDIVDDFHDYADLCFWEFGDRVKFWTTFNETWTYAVNGYVNGTFAPGRGAPDVLRRVLRASRSASQTTRLLSEAKFAGNREIAVESHTLGAPEPTQGDPGTEPYRVTHNQLLCHADAVILYRQKYQPSQKGKIGITMVSHWFEPLDEDSENDKKAAKRAIDFMLGWIIEPLTFGDYPFSMRTNVGNRLPKFSTEQKASLQGSFDFIGINHYTSYYAKANDQVHSPPNFNSDSHVLLESDRNGVPIGEQASGVDWLYIYPKGIYSLLSYIKKTYNELVIYITENGVSEKNDPMLVLPQSVNDQTRIHYLSDYLWNVLDAINDGVDVRGYFVWSLMDNFEWNVGYTARFGIMFVDYNNELARHPKESAKWFKNFLKKNQSTTPSKKRPLSFTNDSAAKVLKR